MAKNFNNISMDTNLDNGDKLLVGQIGGQDKGIRLGEIKNFISSPLPKDFKNGLIIPAYLYPADAYTNADFGSLINFKRENRTTPMIVIVNPSSGPSTVSDGNYTMIINNMRAAGIYVVGYISTGYGVTAELKTLEDVKNDVDSWKNFYPKIDGIFFDEQSDGTVNLQSEQDFYKELVYYSRENGFDINISNPGVNVDNSWYDIFDIVVEWENNTQPEETAYNGAWPGGKQFYKRAALVYGDAPGNFSFVPYYGWFYFTDVSGSNPWNAISSRLYNHMQMIDGGYSVSPTIGQ